MRRTLVLPYICRRRRTRNTHRLHHATELKDGVLKPCFEMPSRADTILARVQAVGLGEVIAPLVSDRPFVQELTVEGGIRYSKYKVDTAGSPRFNATTYKFGATWAPVDDLKFRGNYQRAVRAPNIGELFAPVVTGLTSLATDPCAGAAPTLDANLRAVCLAQGAPAASIGAIQTPSADQANATGGGNPNIRPETAKTFTVGMVLQPRNFVSGLTVSVDYYNIKVSGAITTLPAGAVTPSGSR